MREGWQLVWGRVSQGKRGLQMKLDEGHRGEVGILLEGRDMLVVGVVRHS